MSVEAKETTSDTSAGIECPECGAVIQDLWDYAWGPLEDIEITCGECSVSIVLMKRERVTYSARAKR